VRAEVKPRLIPQLREWPGYVGKFVRDQAVGAIPNGQRVVKINSEPGDLNNDGDTGIVIGSIDVVKAAPSLANKYRARFLYFVEWEGMPKVVVGIKDWRVGLPQ
jgi:hypothetical protein